MSKFCFVLVSGVLLLSIGCKDNPQGTPWDTTAPTDDPTDTYGEPNFKDNVESNVEPLADAFELNFVDRNGQPVSLDQFRGQKNVVLVVTRGFSNGIFCPHCMTQTSRLIRNYDKFEQRNAEVVVVYPGAAGKAKEFANKVEQSTEGKPELPFELVIDENLAAVDRLQIRGDLAKPSTFILDKEGNVRFAYVGKTRSDRPSLKAMLALLDLIEGA